MYGLNPVRKQIIDPLGRLWVQEVFATLQGEGEFAGTPSVFLRLAGCNLRCDFCDTDFESGFDEETNFLGVDDLMLRIGSLVHDNPGCNNIVITGGEPFRQNFVPLARSLIAIGYTVEVETAGTLFLEGFHKIASNCHVTVSPKTPKLNESIETIASAYKYVVSDYSAEGGDALVPLSENGKQLPLPKYGQPIFIQPMDDQNKQRAERNIQAAVNMTMQTGWRLSVQTHKMLGIE